MSAGKPQSKYSCKGDVAKKKKVFFDEYSVIYFGCNTQQYALTAISVVIWYVCWPPSLSNGFRRGRSKCMLHFLLPMPKICVREMIFFLVCVLRGKVRRCWASMSTSSYSVASDSVFDNCAKLSTIYNVLLVQDVPFRLFYRWRREVKHMLLQAKRVFISVSRPKVTTKLGDAPHTFGVKMGWEGVFNPRFHC